MIGTENMRKTMSRLMSRLAMVAALALVAVPTAVRADKPARDDEASCQVLEVKASNDGEEIDAELKPLARKLKKPPFSAWKRFRLLKRHDRAVTRMKATDLDLVPGGKLSILYREQAGGRLRLTFTLDDKSGKRLFNGTVNLDVGDYSLIGGEPFPGEGDATYIIGVSCKV